MSKLQLDIPEDVHRILKQEAEADERSLTKYIIRLLKAHTQHSIYYNTNTTINSTPISTPISKEDELAIIQKNRKFEEEDDGWGQLQ